MTTIFERIERIVRRKVVSPLASVLPSKKFLKHVYYPQQPTCQIPHLYFLFERFLGKRENGHYVEVGAYDGLCASNTWGLASRGWHGLLIEPVPQLAEECRRNYASSPHTVVEQVAIGDCCGRIVLQLAGTLTTANRKVYREYANVDWAKRHLTSKEVDVECRILNQVLIEHQVPHGFDLLVVDVEGFERQVFAGFDLEVWKPRMLIVELLDTHPDLTATEGHDYLLGRTLTAAGYVISYKDSVNTVFVREDVWLHAFGTS